MASNIKQTVGSSFLESFSKADDVQTHLSELDNIFAVFNKSFLPKFFSLFGLLYFFRLAYDLGAFTAEILRKEDGSFSLSILKRNFKKALEDEERNHRMIEDAISAAINLTCLLVNPLLIIVMTSLNYAFSIAHDLTRIFFTLRAHNHLKKLKDELIGCQSEIERLNENKYLNHNEIIKNKKIEETLKERIAVIEDKNPDLKKSRNKLIFEKCYDITKKTMLSVGVILCFFPPTALIGAFLLASGLTLVINDFIKETYKNKCLPKKQKDSENKKESTSTIYKTMDIPISPQLVSSVKNAPDNKVFKNEEDKGETDAANVSHDCVCESPSQRPAVL